jgi:HD superfamily phosphohydrolase
MSNKEKQFKDPIHGYISVPSDWCSDLVDTKIFQRLRHIEQTSMRSLYPAAHHDRFIHSLGTYHLGRRLLQSLIQNTTDDDTKRLLQTNRISNTFLIACLMHDCGHAPFSHTTECFYNYTEAKNSNRAYELLQKEFPACDFKVDNSFEPAPHEAFSAVVLKRFYGELLTKKYECDIELAARMITGCTYPDENDREHQLANRMIALLNGKAIDVDKLDYILRDTWSSGVQNTAIDIDRLLAATLLHIDTDGTIQLCYSKSALSVLQNVVDARNYLYEWVINHHTVLYYSQLLDRSLKKLAKLFASPADQDIFWKSVFSLAPFLEPVKISEAIKDDPQNITVYLPTDGDLLYALKQFATKINRDDIEELLSHKSRRVALWKTYAEFRLLFKGKPVTSPQICDSVAKNLPNLLSKNFSCEEDDVLVVSARSKHYEIQESHVNILMDGESKPFTDVIGEVPQRKPASFFYIFVPPTLLSEKQKIIAMIRSQTR